MWAAYEDNLRPAWQPRTRLREASADTNPEARTETESAESRKVIQLVTQALRPFAEARAAVVRALRLDLGIPEVPA
jgi:hypothetical protein